MFVMKDGRGIEVYDAYSLIVRGREFRRALNCVLMDLEKGMKRKSASACCSLKLISCAHRHAGE